jgi:hypothetical protein
VKTKAAEVPLPSTAGNLGGSLPTIAGKSRWQVRDDYRFGQLMCGTLLHASRVNTCCRATPDSAVIAL